MATTEQPVFTVEHPEFPMLLYNHETRISKSARDQEEKDKLAKEGFVEEPLPPVSPDALTQEEVTQLQALLAKAAKALAKLGELSQTQKTSTPSSPAPEPVKKKS
jgi:hypothetical protein